MFSICKSDIPIQKRSHCENNEYIEKIKYFIGMERFLLTDRIGFSISYALISFSFIPTSSFLISVFDSLHFMS